MLTSAQEWLSARVPGAARRIIDAGLAVLLFATSATAVAIPSDKIRGTFRDATTYSQLVSDSGSEMLFEIFQRRVLHDSTRTVLGVTTVGLTEIDGSISDIVFLNVTNTGTCAGVDLPEGFDCYRLSFASDVEGESLAPVATTIPECGCGTELEVTDTLFPTWKDALPPFTVFVTSCSEPCALVPEPEPWLLLGTGLAAIAGSTRVRALRRAFPRGAQRA